MAIGLLLGLAIGIVMGVLVTMVMRSRRDSTGAIERAHLQAERDAALSDAERERARRLAEREELDATLESIKNEIIVNSSRQLVDLATERFTQVTESVKQDLNERDVKLSGELRPIQTLLDQYNANLQDVERKRISAYQQVTEQIATLRSSEESLQRETRALVTALRQPHVRGRWGEMQLRRVVEIAGMVEHCDFVEQASVGVDGGVQRPDLLVTLPSDGIIVVDAKAPLAAYLDVTEAETEQVRREHLANHARQLSNHVNDLSKKAYWDQFASTPDLVVCFVPGEALIQAAFEADPDLFERAMKHRVLLCGPTSLVGLLLTISFGWRQEALAQNAETIRGLGQEIYERLATLGGHLDKLGRSIAKSVDAYNDVIGAAETRVMVTARRFEALGGASSAGKDIARIAPIDQVPRGLSSAELLFSAQAEQDLRLVDPDEGAAG